MSEPIPIADAALARWRGWIGRTEQRSDAVHAAPLDAWAATLDRDDPLAAVGADVPPLAHWLFFLPLARQSTLGPDGHPQRGGFLPPIDLPRRMWAGGRLQFLQPLRVGDAITRTSRIAGVDAKSGKSGALAFVTVSHEIGCPRGVAIAEQHEIVYRDAPQPGAVPPTPPAAAADETFSRRIVPDPVLLFRYSALTFNGHRIHYDRDYVTKVEGYPGLVFHGPLQAAFIVEFAAKLHGGRPPKKFVYRGVQPLFEGSEFSVNASDNGNGGTDLWTANAEGQPTMKGTATW
jgi:3-methylfumaryl-CoA hydratase